MLPGARSLIQILPTCTVCSKLDSFLSPAFDICQACAAVESHLLGLTTDSGSDALPGPGRVPESSPGGRRRCRSWWGWTALGRGVGVDRELSSSAGCGGDVTPGRCGGDPQLEFGQWQAVWKSSTGGRVSPCTVPPRSPASSITMLVTAQLAEPTTERGARWFLRPGLSVRRPLDLEHRA